MRSTVSISIAVLFVSLTVSGIWLFISKANPLMVFLHVFFGGLFLLISILHFSNNFKSIRKYLSLRKGKSILLGAFVMLILAFFEIPPVAFLNQAYARYKSRQPQKVILDKYEIYQTSVDSNLTLELRAGKHFWFPQIALWLEDTTGTFLQTLWVTHSTAKGDFIGGRTKENFKTFDFDRSEETSQYELRRVDALPYWSHSRGIQAMDGLFAPMVSNPIPDAISGATPSGSFLLNTRHPNITKFKVMLEVNVAFDDNKFYSEYDFPEDSLYHSGTGLLGQPSIVYETLLDVSAPQRNYLMKYKGHTFPSGVNGHLFLDKVGLTTALQIIDLAIISVR